jgi:L-ascorbate metabolism protein UlaG (beta-lactamase superfamily)
MEFQYYGANCVRISTKKASIVIDDNLADLGAKSVTKPGEIALFTMQHGLPAVDVKIAIDQPGEFEVSDMSIQAMSARAHIDEAGQKTATMFKLIGEDVRVAVLGHIYPDLNNNQLEALGIIDVLIIPVGGNGYTLDPVGALKLIKAIGPKIVIPTHFDDKALNYPVPQQTLEDALKGLGMEARDTVAKLKVKAGEMAENTQLVLLEKL